MLNPAALSSGLAVFLRRYARALVASVALTIGFAWVLRAGALPLLPPEGTLARTDAKLVALTGLCLLVSSLVRSVRYRFLLAPVADVQLSRLLKALFISYGLMTLLPFRLGELARPVLLREKGKLSAWAVTGTVGAERTIDGVVIGLMLLGSLAIAKPITPLPDHIGNLPVPAVLVPRAALVATIGFVSVFLVMLVFYRLRDLARRVTEAVVGLVSEKLAKTVADTVARLSDGLRFLTNVRYTLPYLLMTVGALCINVVGVLLLAAAVGLPPLNFAQGALVLGVLALGFAMPNAPGYFGAVQLALYAGLAVYVEPAKVVREGAAFVFLYYLLYLGQVLLITLAGIVAEYWQRDPVTDIS